MHILIVVSAQLLFFFGAPAAKRFLQVSVGILAADHEPNLARRVGGNGGVGIFGGWKNFAAIFLQFGDERKMKPLIFSCSRMSVGGGTALGK